MNRWQRLAPILSAAVAGLLAMVLYRQALGFGFFNDDPTGHFAWMEGRSVLDFFISSAEYGYYRPVVFTVLRLMEIPFGGHDPVANHALLLLLHGANVAMVWLLAYVLSRKSTAFAWVAALCSCSVQLRSSDLRCFANPPAVPVLVTAYLAGLQSLAGNRSLCLALAVVPHAGRRAADARKWRADLPRSGWRGVGGRAAVVCARVATASLAVRAARTCVHPALVCYSEER